MLPAREGVSQLREQQEELQLRQSKLMQQLSSSSATLPELSRDFAVFSMAALLLYGQLPGDPVQAWLEQHPTGDVVLGPVRYSTPVVKTGPTPYDGILWLCERPAWPALRQWLAGLAGWDPRIGRLWLAQHKTLLVEDPQARARLAVLPTQLPQLALEVFDLSATEATYRWCVQQGYATLVRGPSEQRVQQEAVKYGLAGGVIAGIQEGSR